MITEAQIKENNLQYPFIAKPDIGMKGLAVMKVENLAQLQQYNNNIPIPYLLQSLITLPNELGIFYCKYRLLALIFSMEVWRVMILIMDFTAVIKSAA